MGFLNFLGKRAFQKDTLSSIAAGMNNELVDARCGGCGQSFRLPFRQIFLPWKFDEKTIDVGGYCIRCEQFVCSIHAMPIELTMPNGQKGWTLAHAACGGGVLMAEEVRRVHEQKKAGG